MEDMYRSGFPEGAVINKWMANRINDNKNALIVTVGSTGSGKSYCNLREFELWYKYYFKMDKPPYENICFSLSEAMKRMKSGLPKGSMIIIEEAGVLMNSLDFQNKIAKFFGYVLQSFRSKNLIVVFNLPNMGFLNKTARLLLHMILITKEIDKAEKQVIVKALRFQVNAMTSKIYAKYMMVDGMKIKEIGFSLPSKELIDFYEQKKDSFVNKVMDDTLEEMDSSENNNQDTQSIEQSIEEAIKEYNGKPTVNQVLQFIRVSNHTFYKKGYNVLLGRKLLEFSKKNTIIEANKPILAPIST